MLLGYTANIESIPAEIPLLLHNCDRALYDSEGAFLVECVHFGRFAVCGGMAEDPDLVLLPGDVVQTLTRSERDGLIPSELAGPLVLCAGGEDGRHEDYAKESEDEREGQGLKH